jgi:hypothetical protein
MRSAEWKTLLSRLCCSFFSFLLRTVQTEPALSPPPNLHYSGNISATKEIRSECEERELQVCESYLSLSALHPILPSSSHCFRSLFKPFHLVRTTCPRFAAQHQCSLVYMCPLSSKELHLQPVLLEPNYHTIYHTSTSDNHNVSRTGGNC